MSRSQFQSKRFILRHAWLNLWDERMTTGRINQVATNRVSTKNTDCICWLPRIAESKPGQPMAFKAESLNSTFPGHDYDQFNHHHALLTAEFTLQLDQIPATKPSQPDKTAHQSGMSTLTVCHGHCNVCVHSQLNRYYRPSDENNNTGPRKPLVATSMMDITLRKAKKQTTHHHSRGSAENQSAPRGENEQLSRLWANSRSFCALSLLWERHKKQQQESTSLSFSNPLRKSESPGANGTKTKTQDCDSSHSYILVFPLFW